jgi:plasmid stabilization system protein ParE
VSQPANFARTAQAEIAKALDDYAQSPAAMRRFQDALAAAARLIGAHPAAGRHELQLADERYRFWSLHGFPYLLVYRPTSCPPLILRVVRTSYDLAPLLASLAGSLDTDEPPA